MAEKIIVNETIYLYIIYLTADLVDSAGRKVKAFHQGHSRCLSTGLRLQIGGHHPINCTPHFLTIHHSCGGGSKEIGEKKRQKIIDMAGVICSKGAYRKIKSIHLDEICICVCVCTYGCVCEHAVTLGSTTPSKISVDRRATFLMRMKRDWKSRSSNALGSAWI